MGKSKADVVLKNCRLVNVFSREIIPQIHVAIKKDRIAYVGKDASHTVGEKTGVIDLQDRYITPGFVDSHVHIDQYVLPSELAKKSLLLGTTALFADPIDIVSVCGYRGFKEFVKMTQRLPIRVYHVIPGGLPVDRKFSHARTLTKKEELEGLDIENVVGLGEVFSWTKVTTRDPNTMKSISNVLETNGIINGHTAGASDKKLNAYIASGIFSCHEPIDYDQVLERLRLGMWVMMREGSIRRDLDKILPSTLSHKTYLDRLMFCTDGVNPKDIVDYGMIDHCIRKSISIGMDPIDAITIASRNSFEYYGMSKDLGAIAPGKLADILVFDDLEKIKPNKVFVGGKLMVAHNSLVVDTPRTIIPDWMRKTVKTGIKFGEKDFVIPCKENTAQALIIKLDTEIITKTDQEELQVIDGNVVTSYDKDVWKVAAIDRTYGTGKKSVAFLRNFGADVGAFGCTQSFHENDMIIVGSNEKDMAFVANTLTKMQGGMIVAKNGNILSKFSLPLAGLISSLSFEKTLDEYASIDSKLIETGCKFKNPHLIPLFLPFLALPEIRILYTGVVDVKNRRYLKILNR
ncbi:MAG: adenine deaminase [Thaumarchaeota archaeon]|nr:adenine deaminase [Nitrososphaerota archaeon]MDE1832090.1 adenine deaminase [Nitrososphaerota archaeon]MDE1841214.1 adenine deaminase [Nitrososphaerota archaeon]MDE1878119.1 adenine deaminase [Nitrososphaerota archaeon]